MLVDLEGDEGTWNNILEKLLPQKEGVKVVAFGPHEDTDALEHARELGCDTALSKGEFNRDLPQIIQGLAKG